VPIRSSEEYCHARGCIKARASVDARDSPAKAAHLGFPTPALTPSKDDGVLRNGLGPDRTLAGHLRLAARGASASSHRDRGCARLARRERREYCLYLSVEQRSQAGCSVGRMQTDLHHGLLEPVRNQRYQCLSSYRHLWPARAPIMQPLLISRALEEHDGENARPDDEYLAQGAALEGPPVKAGDEVRHRDVQETRRGHGQEVRQDAGQVTDRESREEHATDGRQS